jgi:hypothetical protein
MEIHGKKRREIREALTEAFPQPNDLRRLTDEILDEPLQMSSRALPVRQGRKAQSPLG